MKLSRAQKRGLRLLCIKPCVPGVWDIEAGRVPAITLEWLLRRRLVKCEVRLRARYALTEQGRQIVGETNRRDLVRVSHKGRLLMSRNRRPLGTIEPRDRGVLARNVTGEEEFGTPTEAICWLVLIGGL